MGASGWLDRRLRALVVSVVPFPVPAAAGGDLSLALLSPPARGPISGSDYAAISAQTVNLAAGGPATATVTVQVTGDSNYEPDETFQMNLSIRGGATIADGKGTGQLYNDEVGSR